MATEACRPRRAARRTTFEITNCDLKDLSMKGVRPERRNSGARPTPLGG